MAWTDLTPILSPLHWAVIGAVATRLYMPERVTQDLDVAVSGQDALKTRERLAAAGFRHARYRGPHPASNGAFPSPQPSPQWGEGDRVSGKMGRGTAPSHLPRTSFSPPRVRGGAGEGQEAILPEPRDVSGSTWLSPAGEMVDVIEGHEPWWTEALSEAQTNRDATGLPVLPLRYLILVKFQSGRVQDMADVTRMLGQADEATLGQVRALFSRYAPSDLPDLESLITLGRLELGDDK